MTETTYAPTPAGAQPPFDAPGYGSTRARHPLHAPLRVPYTTTETMAPRMDAARYPDSVDLTMVDGHAAMGERIIVAGRVLDEDGRPVRGALVELWQANSAGRYHHERDQHAAPLDPHFTGVGTAHADADGWYRFTTVRPGAYPWGNHPNAWRPTHIHFSLHGDGFAQRMITQMYFPGDPLLPLDPIFMALEDATARERLIGRFDLDVTQQDWALGYRFDLVLRGRAATPFEAAQAGSAH